MIELLAYMSVNTCLNVYTVHVFGTHNLSNVETFGLVPAVFILFSIFDAKTSLDQSPIYY